MRRFRTDINADTDIDRPSAAGIPAWVAPGAAIDLDFINQRYFWGGALKTTAHFTTYTLSGSTFGANGLTPTATIDITLSLAGLGTFLPGAWAGAHLNTGDPGSVRYWFSLDNGGANERISLLQNTPPSSSQQCVVGGVAQCSIGSGAPGTTLGVRYGTAASFATNDFKAALNGAALAADSAGTLPVVTTLRLCRSVGANSNPSGALTRFAAFTAVKTQAELNALSLVMQTFS